jgi:hypothetical protein
MLKVKNITHKFIGKDIEEPILSEVEYTIYIYRPDGFNKLILSYLNSEGDDLDNALQLVGMTLISVSQDGQSHSIGNLDNAKSLMQSIEDQAPGYGAAYIKRLAIGIYRQIDKIEDERLENFPELPEVSSNGSDQKSLVSITEKSDE